MKNSIKKNWEFQNIFNQKRVIKNENFIIYYEKSKDFKFKFGIAVGKKKFKFAFVRNKVKRWVRNVIIENKEFVNKINYRIIIIVNIDIYNIKYKVFNDSLISLLKQLKD